MKLDPTYNLLKLSQKIRDHQLKFLFDYPSKFLFKHNLTPNNVTFFGYIFKFISLLTAFNWPITTAFLILIGLYFDSLDGFYARNFNKISKLGIVLDHVGDFIFGWCLLLKGYFYLGRPSWLLIPLVLGWINLFLLVFSKRLKTMAVANIFDYLVLINQPLIGAIVQSIILPLSFISQILSVLKKRN
jgi:phosphatidylglycerophosphate synthase